MCEHAEQANLAAAQNIKAKLAAASRIKTIWVAVEVYEGVQLGDLWNSTQHGMGPTVAVIDETDNIRLGFSSRRSAQRYGQLRVHESGEDVIKYKTVQVTGPEEKF